MKFQRIKGVGTCELQLSFAYGPSCMLRRVAQLLRLRAAFIHCLHFIYVHKFCVHTLVQITLQWKSTITELLHTFRFIYLLIIDTFVEIPAK